MIALFILFRLEVAFDFSPIQEILFERKILLVLSLFMNGGGISVVVTNSFILGVCLVKLRHETRRICSVCLTPLLKAFYE